VVSRIHAQLSALYEALEARDADLCRKACMELVMLNFRFAIDNARFNASFQIAFSQAIHALSRNCGMLFNAGYDHEAFEALVQIHTIDVNYFMGVLTAWAAEDDLVNTAEIFQIYADQGKFPDAVYEAEM